MLCLRLIILPAEIERDILTALRIDFLRDEQRLDLAKSINPQFDKR